MAFAKREKYFLTIFFTIFLLFLAEGDSFAFR